MLNINQICCAITMKGSFVKENSITANKVTKAIRNALSRMDKNPEEVIDLLLSIGLNSGNREKT